MELNLSKRKGGLLWVSLLSASFLREEEGKLAGGAKERR